MDEIKARDIATRYAQNIDKIFNIIKYAGIKDNQYVFVIESTLLSGQKTGLPYVVKIDVNGVARLTRNISEVMWAIKSIKASEK